MNDTGNVSNGSIASVCRRPPRFFLRFNFRPRSSLGRLKRRATFDRRMGRDGTVRHATRVPYDRRFNLARRLSRARQLKREKTASTGRAHTLCAAKPKVEAGKDEAGGGVMGRDVQHFSPRRGGPREGSTSREQGGLARLSRQKRAWMRPPPPHRVRRGWALFSSPDTALLPLTSRAEVAA